MNRSCQWDVGVVFSSRRETNLILYGLCKEKILASAKDMPADSFAAQTEVFRREGYIDMALPNDNST